MKLEVMTGTKEEFEAAISRPEGEVTMANYMAYMQEQLEAAEAARQETACFQSLEMTGTNSIDFRNIGWIERAVQMFQQEHALPKTVRIVCDSAKAAENYKVVYNFYYASSKADRLEDDKWD